MAAKELQSTILIAAAILVSGVIWFLFGLLNNTMSSFTAYTPGIDLIYLPAGVRLGIVLVFRVWGAIGITIASPFLFPDEFAAHSFTELAVNSVITGFVPLLTVIGICWLMRVDRNLTTFRALHLPAVALAASITAPIAFNANFIVSGYKPANDFWSNLTAMMFGDFTGCLIVLIIMRLAIYLYRLSSDALA